MLTSCVINGAVKQLILWARLSTALTTDLACLIPFGQDLSLFSEEEVALGLSQRR